MMRHSLPAWERPGARPAAMPALAAFLLIPLLPVLLQAQQSENSAQSEPIAFEIGADVYRKAFEVQAYGVFAQRCGIELGPPYSDWRWFFF